MAPCVPPRIGAAFVREFPRRINPVVVAFLFIPLTAGSALGIGPHRTAIPVIEQPTQSPAGPEAFGKLGMTLSDRLPFGAVVQDGTQGKDLEIAGKRLVNGTGRYEPGALKNTRDIPAELRVSQLQVPERTTLLQVDVSKGKPLSLAAKSIDNADRDQPPRLTSSDGQVFEAIGYYYEDDRKVLLRYTIAGPIRSLKELEKEGVLPTISRSDQKLVLFFAPSAGVDIKSFGLGPKVVKEFDRPISTKSP